MLLTLLLACVGGSFGDPCQDYCDYVCDCHAGEPGFDCDQCRVEYANPDADIQDECETSRIELEREDDDAGHVCGADTGG